MNIKELLKAALAPVLWGTLYIISTEILPQHHPFFISAMRSLPLGLILFLYYRQLPSGSWWLKSIALGAISVTISFATFFIGADRLPGGVASTINALQPVVVIALSRFILQKKVHIISMGAGVLGVIGVGLLVLSSDTNLNVTGIIATIIATITLSLAGVLIKKWGIPVKLPVFLSWIFLSGGLLLVPLIFIFEKQIPAFTLKNSLGYAYLSLVATGLAYFFWYRGINKLNPSITSFLVLLTPLVASALGYFILGETFTTWQTVGAGIVVAGVVLGEVGQSKKMRKKSIHFCYQLKYKAMALVK